MPVAGERTDVVLEEGHRVRAVLEDGVEPGRQQLAYPLLASLLGDAEHAADDHRCGGEPPVPTQRADEPQPVLGAVAVDAAEDDEPGGTPQALADEEFVGHTRAEVGDRVAEFLDQELEVHQVPGVGVGRQPADEDAAARRRQAVRAGHGAVSGRSGGTVSWTRSYRSLVTDTTSPPRTTASAGAGRPRNVSRLAVAP